MSDGYTCLDCKAKWSGPNVPNTCPYCLSQNTASDDVPRRNDLRRNTHAELAIRRATAAVEGGRGMSVLTVEEVELIGQEIGWHGRVTGNLNRLCDSHTSLLAERERLRAALVGTIDIIDSIESLGFQSLDAKTKAEVDGYRALATYDIKETQKSGDGR